MIQWTSPLTFSFSGTVSPGRTLGITQFVFAGSTTIDFKESSIKRLAVGKSYHLRNILHLHVGIATVCENAHSLLYTIFIDKGCIIHMKAHIDHGRYIASIGAQILGQILGRIILVLVFLLDKDYLKYFCFSSSINLGFINER